MVYLPNADDFPSFCSIDPYPDDFTRVTCIWPWTTKGQPCRCLVAKRLRKATASIKEQILREPPSEHRSALLLTFIENCGCKGYHRDLLVGTPLAEKLRQRWESELKEREDAQAQSREDPLHTQPASAEVSPRAQHVELPASATSPSNLRSRYWLRSQGSVPPVTGPSSETEGRTSTTQFEPVLRAQTLTDKILKTLTPKKDLLTGSIYAFTRDSDRDKIKIGHTGRDVDERLGEWARDCHYTPILLHSVEDVPHMVRVETLVHYELLPYRRRELKCRHNKKCPTLHEEWFQCVVEMARQSMDNFSTWMRVAKPYDEYGMLKPRWRNFILRMKREGREVTSQSLLDAMEGTQQSGAIEVLTTPRVSETTISSLNKTPERESTTTTTTTTGSILEILDTEIREIDMRLSKLSGELTSKLASLYPCATTARWGHAYPIYNTFPLSYPNTRPILV